MKEEPYRPFDGICLTDTFRLCEEADAENLYSEQFPTDSQRVIAQKKKPITVIISNPPYSAWGRSRPTTTHKTITILVKKRE